MGCEARWRLAVGADRRRRLTLGKGGEIADALFLSDEAAPLRALLPARQGDVPLPSPKCLQNPGGFRGNGANTREIQSIRKWQGLKRLGPEVAPHQPVTRVHLTRSNPCLTAIRLRSRTVTRALARCLAVAAARRRRTVFPPDSLIIFDPRSPLPLSPRFCTGVVKRQPS